MWVSVGLFGVLLSAFMGFWLWAEFGFERTITIIETVEAPSAEVMAPKAASMAEPGTEEAAAAPVAETAPDWLEPVRWGTMAGAAAVAAAIVYLELMHRRRRDRPVRTRD